ncbi:hypothetical protein [Acinetobacter sp. TSRC1-2]|uniref:hypothetical protein n=1 Tax=unclassified Acinetobacter TaxID=196816 RepID=UPI003CFA1F74
MKFIKRNVELQDDEGNKKIFRCVFEKKKSTLLDAPPDSEIEVWVGVIINGRPVKVERHYYFCHPDTGEIYTI